MSTTLRTKLAIKLDALYKSTAEDLRIPKSELLKEVAITLANGQGLNKAECVWGDIFDSSDAGATIDVFGGITDVWGNALSMDQVKILLIINNSLVTGEYIDVFGSAQHLEFMTGATDEIRVFPGGGLLMWAPGAAADSPSPGAGAADEVLITAAAGKTPSVTIIIVGENN